MTTTQISSNAATYLLGTATAAGVREYVIESLTTWGNDYDVDTIVAQFTDAINAALPEGVTVAGDIVYADIDAVPTEDDLETIREQVAGIDFWGIVAANER